MAADGATRLSLPHPPPGRDDDVGPRLLIRQAKSMLILQIISISTGHSTIRHLWTRVVAVTALPHHGRWHT